jgi:hypothetical protein
MSFNADSLYSRVRWPIDQSTRKVYTGSCRRDNVHDVHDSWFHANVLISGSVDVDVNNGITSFTNDDSAVRSASCRGIWYRSSTATTPSATAASVKCKQRKIQWTMIQRVSSSLHRLYHVRGCTRIYGLNRVRVPVHLEETAKINEEKERPGYVSYGAFRSANRSTECSRVFSGAPRH